MVGISPAQNKELTRPPTAKHQTSHTNCNPKMDKFFGARRSGDLNRPKVFIENSVFKDKDGLSIFSSVF